MTVRKAEQQVAELEREKARCQERIEALQQERETAKVGRLGPIASELAELHETVKVVDNRLDEARGVLADERQKANEAQIVKLRQAEADANAKVLVKRDEMDEALQALASVHVQLGQFGARPHLGDTILFQAVRQSQAGERFRKSMSNM